MASAYTTSEERSPSPTPPTTDKLWEVEAILAERTSISTGVNEVLVVWKPCWIPIVNVPPGPVLSDYRAAPKSRYTSSLGKLILPVEPNTTLADDIQVVTDRAEQQLATHYREQHRSGESAPVRVGGTPRKSLGSVAKRAAPDPSNQRK